MQSLHRKNVKSIWKFANHFRTLRLRWKYSNIEYLREKPPHYNALTFPLCITPFIMFPSTKFSDSLGLSYLLFLSLQLNHPKTLLSLHFSSCTSPRSSSSFIPYLTTPRNLSVPAPFPNFRSHPPALSSITRPVYYLFSLGQWRYVCECACISV